MKKMIALCGVDEKIYHILEQYGGFQILRFFDERERRGDVKLAYFLQNDPSVELAIVGYSGARGLAACDYLRTQKSTLPILWLCDRGEFEPEARRLGVNFFGTGPPDLEPTIPLILKQCI
ncbi:hypothetical protein [Sinanaerobacter sp. ZZT-01]|uniref:hypothetical protein n=1 Tax=Sinanaerobacter sp. ZZT-01 TaxID=3111540 RepID=UPI002D78CE27|nr:hypothetical protein [Sinanaerobacter sp. ZZT-01]WRR93883.1 hypothetical protein U5921_01800 [Sinanaerobacter sp. ZZT-01]